MAVIPLLFRKRTSAYLPQVAVGAHYGYSNMQANFLRDGLGSKTGNGAVFVSVSVPLTDWWKTGHKIREDNIAVEQARLQEQHTNELLSLRTQQAYDKTIETTPLVSRIIYNRTIYNIRFCFTNFIIISRRGVLQVGLRSAKT